MDTSCEKIGLMFVWRCGTLEEAVISIVKAVSFVIFIKVIINVT